jgi:hypothetical protein
MINWRTLNVICLHCQLYDKCAVLSRNCCQLIDKSTIVLRILAAVFVIDFDKLIEAIDVDIYIAKGRIWWLVVTSRGESISLFNVNIHTQVWRWFLVAGICTIFGNQCVVAINHSIHCGAIHRHLSCNESANHVHSSQSQTHYSRRLDFWHRLLFTMAWTCDFCVSNIYTCVTWVVICSGKRVPWSKACSLTVTHKHADYFTDVFQVFLNKKNNLNDSIND